MDNLHKDEKLLFAERLNHALDIFGIPPKGKGRQITVAKMFAVSQKGASKWLEGQSFPETERLSIIAKRLNVNFEWLVTGKGHINIESIPSPSNYSMKRIPLLDWKDASYWKKISFGENTKWAWADADIGPLAFSLQMIDNSMLPRYEVGDILVIDPELKAQNRTVVIAQKITGEIVCRQFVMEDDKQYLVPHNIEYLVLIINDDNPQIIIIGSIRQVFMKL